MSWRQTLRADLDAALQSEAQPASALTRAAFVALRTGVQAILVFRLAEALTRRGPLAPAAHVLSRLGALFTGAEIAPTARIGPGFAIVHASGVVLAGDVVAGENLRLHTGVVIGHQVGGDSWGAPQIGSDVIIGAGAKVLGPIRIGDGVRIGAGAVVIRDVPDRHAAVGVPARNHALDPSADATGTSGSPLPPAQSIE